MKQYSRIEILILFKHEQADGIPLGSPVKPCLRRKGLKLSSGQCFQRLAALGSFDTRGCQDGIASERKERFNLAL